MKFRNIFRKNWKSLNREQIKKDYMQAVNDGWSLPLARQKAGVSDYGFKVLFEHDEEIQELRREYIRRKNEQQRHPVDRNS